MSHRSVEIFLLSPSLSIPVLLVGFERRFRLIPDSFTCGYKLGTLTENCYNCYRIPSPVFSRNDIFTTSSIRVRIVFIEKNWTTSESSAIRNMTREKYRIIKSRIIPLVERERSSIRVTSISPFLPFDQLFPSPPLQTICMNNESLNESWRRREVDEKIQNVRDACVEARVLITHIRVYIYIFDDTPEAFAFRKLYV